MDSSQSTRERRPSPLLEPYLVAVATAGVCALIDSAIVAWRTPHPIAWVALAAVAVSAGSFRLKFAGNSADIAIDDTFFIAIAMLFGSGPATLAAAACGYILRRRRARRQVVFNTASLALSMWAASRIFVLLARVEPLAISRAPVGPYVLPMLVLCGTYFAFNSGLTAVAIGLDTNESPILLWRRHFSWLSVGYFASGSVAFCLVLLLQQASMTALIVVVPLIAIVHLTLRTSFGRLEDAKRHLGEVDRL